MKANEELKAQFRIEVLKEIRDAFEAELYERQNTNGVWDSQYCLGFMHAILNLDRIIDTEVEKANEIKGA